MATSHTVTCKANADQVWANILSIINASGYPIASTDQASKTLVCQAQGGGFAWPQNAQLSVAALNESSAMLSIVVKSTQYSLTEGKLQNQIIQYFVDELSKRIPLDESAPAQSQAPGAGGCMVWFLLLTSVPVVYAYLIFA